MHDGAERLDIALDAVQATGCIRVVGEPSRLAALAATETTEPAGELGLGPIEAAVLGRDEVVKDLGRCGVSQAPPGQLGLLLTPFPSW